MNKYKNTIAGLAIAALLIFSAGAWAQNSAAMPGPDGIFVWFGRTLPISFQYKLERKTDTNESAWEEIYRTGTIDYSYAAITSLLLQTGSKSAVFNMPDSITIARFITLLSGKQSSDSVYIFNGQPAYIEAMGTGFYDNTALPGIKYEYRISIVDKKNIPGKSSVIKADPYPGKANLAKPVFKEYLTTSGSLVIYFNLDEKNKPFDVRIFKQAKLQTEFADCFPDKFFSRNNEGLMLSFVDSMVIPGVSYQYVVFPVDMLGNLGTPSDTIQINLPESMIAPLEKFEAKVQNNFIELNWRNPKLKNMQSISVFRSTNFDNDFQLINRLPASDSSYTDRFVSRSVSYYYYLVFDGLNESSPPSAKVFTMIDETEKPLLAPGGVKVEQSPKGNLISWNRTETGTRGYYVYRGNGYTATEYLYSPLIISDSAAVSFLDSAQNLVPGQPYCYAVSAINKGNLEGPLSQIAISEALKPELPTPVNLYARQYNDKAMLFWDDLSGLSEHLTGYRVYRKQGDGFKLLSEVLVPSYFDSTIVRGQTYEYAVSAIGIQDAESALSSAFEFSLPSIVPVPPSGFRATQTSTSVILSWDPPVVEGLKAFKIYREKLGEARKELTSIDKSLTGYTDALPGAGNWFYTITSVNQKNKESQFSEEVGVRVE
jgi:fibronectin type 3 domain-containing protein